jgi:hypothetical protein
MKHRIDDREFDLKPLSLADRELVRDLHIRIIHWANAQPFKDVAGYYPMDTYLPEEAVEWFLRVAAFPSDGHWFREIVVCCPLPAHLAAEISDWFSRVAGFPFAEIAPQLTAFAWAAVFKAAGFEKLPDGRFNLLTGLSTC